MVGMGVVKSRLVLVLPVALVACGLGLTGTAQTGADDAGGGGSTSGVSSGSASSGASGVSSGSTSSGASSGASGGSSGASGTSGTSDASSSGDAATGDANVPDALSSCGSKPLCVENGLCASDCSKCPSNQNSCWECRPPGAPGALYCSNAGQCGPSGCTCKTAADCADEEVCALGLCVVCNVATINQACKKDTCHDCRSSSGNLECNKGC